MTDVERQLEDHATSVSATPMASTETDRVSPGPRTRRLVVFSVVAAPLLVAAFVAVGRYRDSGTDVAVRTAGDTPIEATTPAPTTRDDGATDTTEPAPPATTPLTLTLTGDPVRGSSVTMTFHGLEAGKGQDVYLSIETDGPVHTASGGDRLGSMGYGTAVVDDRGDAVFTFLVPNALSGQDDVIPVVPGDRYHLVLSAQFRTGGATGTVPFTVVRADVGRTYPAGAFRGSVECGAPPLEVDFDGKMWIPVEDELDAFPASVRQFPGTFTVAADGTGRFVAADGAAMAFTSARDGYAC